MYGNVVFGERGIHDPPAAFVERDLLHERQAKPHDDAAAKLARRCLGVEDAPAIERAKEASHPYFARHLVHANFAEQSAVTVHGPMSELKRHWRFRFDRHLLAPCAPQNRGVAFPSRLIGESAETAIETADLVDAKTSQRRVVAGKLQKFLHQCAMRRNYRRAD